MKKEIKKFLFNNSTNLIVIILSILTCIIGSMTVKFPYAIILVMVLNLLWFIPPIIKEKRNKKNTSYKVNKGEHMKKSKKEKPVKTKKKKKIFKKILLGLLIVFIICFIGAILFFMYIAAKAPKFDPNKLYHQESTIIYDKDGNVKAKLGAEKREIIKYEQMSENLINAIIATEDARFFNHNGFDLPRFAVASAKQLVGQSSAGGASTLTMQVVKNHFTSTEDKGLEGVIRKFTDIYMSIFQVEKKYSKEQILEFYANSNYLGGGAYGVEQASLNYFNKNAKDLNVAEAAMIAGLFQAPNSLDPYNNPDKAENRRKTVLYLMERHGYITEKEKKEAEKLTVELILKEKQITKHDQYQSFIDVVANEIEELTGHDPYTVSMEVYTTMDSGRQEGINDIMSGKDFDWENDTVNAGISVVDIKTGAIVAIGGGRNKTGAKSYNTASMTKRQIGSTAKPFYDYGPGLEYENWSTYGPWMDERHSYSDGGAVQNYDGGYRGFMTTREALVDSRNIPALKAFQANKNSNIRKFVTSLGLSPEISSSGFIHEAHAIGGYNGESPLSMSAAVAAFGNGGYYTKPYSFTKIKYRNSDKVYENKQARKKVMSESTAYMMTDMLISTTKSLRQYYDLNGITYATKTGTTNFSKETKAANGLASDAINDLWCIGYSPEYSVAVWYGYDKIYRDNYSRFGNRNNVRLYQAVAKKVYTKNGNFTKPSNVREVTVEHGSNPAKLPSDGTPDNLRVTELFKAGTEPTEVSTTHSKLQNVSNLNGSISDGKVTLTWDKVNGLANVKEDYGSIGYDVYKKENGTLTLIRFTTGNSFTANISTTEKSVTYVVKTTYENKKDYASSGSEITITVRTVAPTFSLNGSSSFPLSVGTPFTDPGIQITENGTTSTLATSKWTSIIKDSSNATVALSSFFNTAGTYIITYTITVDGGGTSSLTRTVIVS